MLLLHLILLGLVSAAQQNLANIGLRGRSDLFSAIDLRDAGKMEVILDGRVFEADQHMIDVMDRAIRYSRDGILLMLLEHTMIPDQQEQNELIKTALSHHATDCLKIMFEHGFAYIRPPPESQEPSDHERSLWNFQYCWNADDIASVMGFEGFRGLVGDHSSLASIRCDRIGAILVRLMLEEWSAESILWTLISSELFRLEDSDLLGLLQIVLKGKLSLEAFESLDLIGTFLATHPDKPQSLLQLMEHPSIPITVNENIDLEGNFSVQESTMLWLELGPLLQACKLGDCHRLWALLETFKPGNLAHYYSIIRCGHRCGQTCASRLVKLALLNYWRSGKLPEQSLAYEIIVDYLDKSRLFLALPSEFWLPRELMLYVQVFLLDLLLQDF